MTTDMEKAEVLVAVLASVFIGKTGLKECRTPETRGKVWNKVDFTLVEEARLGTV